MTLKDLNPLQVLAMGGAIALLAAVSPVPTQAKPLAIADAAHPDSHPSHSLPPSEPAEAPGQSSGDTPSDHHSHGALVVPADHPAPTVTLVVTPDPVSGWNLELQTTNFEFAPENINQTSTPNEGHAHLYIDGEKQGRIYANWHHLNSLPPGEHRIGVTLNTNGHQELIVNGEPVGDEVTLTVP